MKSIRRRQKLAFAAAWIAFGMTRVAPADETIEVTGNVYCRSAEDAVERPLGAVRVYLKQRPDLIAESGTGNGKFRLLVPASEVIDRDIVMVYRDARFQLGEDARHVVHDDVTVAAGRMALQLAPRIFIVPNCIDLDNAGLRETVRLAVERMSHRAAVVHGELVRAHSAGNVESSSCLNDALSRIGAHLRFAEGRVPLFMDAIGEDSVRARREVTAIKIADERVSELVEEADQCLERGVPPELRQVTRYDPDPLVSPSELATINVDGTLHPAPWGRNRPGAAMLPEDEEWHFYPGTSFETGYDSNFLQKNQDRGSYIAPEGWQFRPSLHLSLRRFDLKSATASPALMQSGPVQSGNLTLMGMFLTSAQSGGQSLGIFSDVGVAADFKNRFGDEGPLGGSLTAKYNRLVEPTIEPEHSFTFGTNAISLSAEVLMRPGAGRFEAGGSYRLGMDYHDGLAQKPYDRVRHAAAIRERWLFLPETAFVHETELSSLTYVGEQRALNDSVQIRSRLGLVGVIGQRLAVEAMGGRAEGYYSNMRGNTPDFAGFVGSAKVEWFLGAISPRSYARLALVRPSLAVSFEHDYRDNITSDYYRFDRGNADLALGIDERWYVGIHAGVARIAYPRSKFFNPSSGQQDYFSRFYENRIDLAGALEYRIVPQVRFTLSARYDRNLSDKELPIDPNYPAIPDRLAFRRIRLYAGVIWAL